MPRDARRSLADKNSMWYDLNACEKNWEDSVKTLLEVVNKSKVNLNKKLQSCALLMCADAIEKDQFLALKKLHFIYRKEYKSEFIYKNLISSGVSDEIADQIIKHISDSFFKSDVLNVNEPCFFGFNMNHIEKVISSLKQCPSLNYKSSDFRDLLQKHLPVISVYKRVEENNVKCFVVKKNKGVDWTKLVSELDWPHREDLFREDVSRRLENLIKQSLEYATEKDRNILKSILVKLTSVEYLNKYGIDGVKFQRTSLNRSTIQSQHSLQYWTDKRGTASNSEIQKIRRKCGDRLEGSGRKLLSEKYPELTSVLLQLFDCQGDGIQSHPRLICDTLFVNKSRWMDMPRCVTILQDVFNINISLSAAYTYTENYRSKSIQAKRHHEGKGINPNISLKRSTRDGHAKSPSINDHFALCDLNYSIEEIMNSGGKVVARDDKALVHCDVEVVQRPSKSWAKVTYSDHDWDKDTQRALQLTTLQFVKAKELSSCDVNFVQLGGFQICQSNLTGGGVSLVKIHFFESSSIFRHFNELLFIMSHQKHAKWFMKEDALVPQIMITVDGGADERPRNKMTMFAAVLLRKLLDLDKVKLISHAEGSSKRHSVERIHFVEGRALSQGGIISSKGKHENELEQGLYSMNKFRENMELARNEAVQRIDGTPYAGERLNALCPPPDEEWVVTSDIVSKIIHFLKKDTTEHRLQSNFVIKPKGPIWERLCETFQLTADKAFNAVSVFNEHCDPHTSWQQHYGYACYRPDDMWHGSPVNRFEIQPIIDFASLPQHKYLPYAQAKLLVQYYTECGLEMPKFLKIPDFYLPSKNINYILEHKQEILENEEQFELFSQLIGSDKDAIKLYIEGKKHTSLVSEKRSNIKEQYKNTTLGTLSNIELKNALEKLQVKWTRQQNNKADLTVLVDKELKKKNLSCDDIFEFL